MTPASSQEKLIRETFTSQKFESPIPANQTPIGSRIIPASWVLSTSNTVNLLKLDIPIPEPESEKKSSSSDEGDVKWIITDEENTIGMELAKSWQTIVEDAQPVKPQWFEHTWQRPHLCQSHIVETLTHSKSSQWTISQTYHQWKEDMTPFKL